MENTLKKYVARNRELFDENHEEFLSVFGKPLKGYFSLVTGFDIARFDDLLIKTTTGKSLRETVRTKYGEKAESLVLKLIEARPKT